MGRFIKWLVVLSAVGVAITLASYAGARLTAGKLLGPKPPLTSRTVQLAFEDVRRMPGDPPAWVFTYQASQLPGVPSARVFVSPTGKLMGTVPADLETRLEAYEQSRLP